MELGSMLSSMKQEIIQSLTGASHQQLHGMRQQQHRPFNKPGNGPSPEDVIKKYYPHLDPSEVDRLKREKLCFKCKKPGHPARECPEK